MLYHFPDGTTAIAIQAYRRPYADPLRCKAGDRLKPDPHPPGGDEFFGWTWCKAEDGRAGWVPDSWLDQDAGRTRIVRDYCALELDATPGDRFILELSESGFVFARKENGEVGWIPDAVLQLLPRPGAVGLAGRQS